MIMKAVSTQQAGSKAAGLRGSGGLAREAGKLGVGKRKLGVLPISSEFFV